MISVITISYNAVSCIERTIRSVIGQTYEDFEYIVVDGGSDDGTVDVIERYSGCICKYVSERDSGIYEAMNKGVRMASGEFCIFMNAGDMFINHDVLAAAAPLLDHEFSIIMGNQVFLSQDGSFLHYGKSWSEVTSGRLFYDSLYHQASFIRRKDLLNFPYDENLHLVSDWKEALLFFIREGLKYKSIDVDVDFFFCGGLTFTAEKQRLMENEIVRKEFYTPGEIEKYTLARISYKRFWNLRRYVNALADRLYQLHKRLEWNNTIKRKLARQL